MACKNDDGWKEGGTFTKIGECVTWDRLVTIRNLHNDLWAALKREERSTDYRWGWGSPSGAKHDPDGWKTGCKNRREEIEGLADIRGYISIRLDYYGRIDAVAFVIDGGEILNRLSYQGVACSSQSCGGCQGQESKYAYNVNRGMGQWAAHLKDPCYGCTIFQLSAQCDVRKEDIVYQTAILDVIEEYYKKGPNTACPINRHWQWLYNPTSMGTVEGYPKICNIDLDWRDTKLTLPIFQSALDLFPTKVKCADEQDPYTTIAENCCGMNAIAHWTEEWDPADQGSAYWQCPADEEIPGAFAPGNIKRWCKRRIKYIDLYNGFNGDVTQIIRAHHLNYIWDRVSSINRALRRCKYEKCEYKHSQNKKDVWVYKEDVVIDDEKESLKQRDTGGSCDECLQPNAGEPICSCEWDDLYHLLATEFPTTSCAGEWGKTSELGGPRPGAGTPYLIYGPITEDNTSCADCLGNCCYNCKCEGGISEIDCKKIKEVKQLKEEITRGPFWMGVYGHKDNCKSCSKRGDIKPCNGFEKGDDADDIGVNPDVQKFIACGFVSACCSPGPPVDEEGNPIDPEWKCSCKPDPDCNCCCEQLTECECTKRGGTWQQPTDEDIKQGKTIDCSTICSDNSKCTESCCKGSWRLYEGGVTYGSGAYCNGCYEGMPKWTYMPCYDYEGYVKLEKTVCGKTSNLGSWTTKCGKPKIDLSSWACPDASDGGPEPDCGDCGKKK